MSFGQGAAAAAAAATVTATDFATVPFPPAVTSSGVPVSADAVGAAVAFFSRFLWPGNLRNEPDTF